jgi:anti-anti-sigma factor
LDRAGGTEGNSLEIETQMIAVGTVVVTLAGDLCADGAARARSFLTGELARAPEFLVLELSQVASIDAEGVDILQLAAELTAEVDIGLCLVAPAEGTVTAALAAVKAVDTFEIYSSLSDALRGRD